MLLTTHFMDEAEVLADRIAVMKTGQLQCCGSTLFLKKRFGLGYSLTVVLENNMLQQYAGTKTYGVAPSPPDAELENGFGSNLTAVSNQGDSKAEQERTILSFLKNFVPDTAIVRHSGREVTFRFPNGFSNRFPALFDAFEEGGMRQKLGIGGYGISNSSLEEVFLRLAEDPSHEESDVDRSVTVVPDESSSQTRDPDLHEKSQNPKKCKTTSESNLSLDAIHTPRKQGELQYLGFAGQISILLKKRALVQRRDIKGFVFMIILPALVVGLVMLVLTIDIPLAGPPIPLSLGLYEDLSFGVGNKTLSIPTSGGAAFQTESPADVDTSIRGREGSLSTDFPFVDFYDIPDANSSDQMSNYLLKTYNSRSHAPRLGSFVVDDRINLHLNVNWDKLWDVLNKTDVFDVSLWGRLLDFSSARSTRKLQGIASVLNPGTMMNVSDDLEDGMLAGPITAWLQGNGSDISQLLALLQRTEIFDSGILQEYLQVGFENVSEPSIGVGFFSSMLPKGEGSYLLGIDSAVSILHNTSSPHGVAVFNHAYAYSRYKKCTGNNGSSFIIVNHPLPVSTKKSLEIRTVLSVMASFFILIPYCFVPSAFIVFVVREKACKSKHVQLVSGVNLSSFWIATYIWDLLLYSILAALIMVIFALYGKESAQVFVGDTESFMATLLLTFGYGMSALPFAYLTSRSFDNHSSAQIAVLGIFFMTGFVAANAYFIMNSIDTTKKIAAALHPIFRLWPPFNVGEGLINLSSSFLKR